MKHFVCLLFSVLFLAGCSQENVTEERLPEGVIDFSDGVLTRGTPIVNADGILSMGVFCGLTNGDFTASSLPNNYMNNVSVSRTNSSSALIYSPRKYWPLEATKKLSFFAYAPHSSTLPAGTLAFSTTGGAPTLTYTVPSDVTKQPDLMVAIPKKNLTKTAGQIAFEMKHALASISFRIAGTNEDITKIAVQGVSVSGTLSLNHTSGTPTWSNLSTATDTEYTAGINSNLTAGSSMSDATAANGYLMMIPQTLGENAKIIVTVDGTDNEVSLSGKTWTAGEQYTYNITIKSTSMIIGYFGGWNETTQEYTKLLEVEAIKTADDPMKSWAKTVETTNTTNREYGPTNISILKGLNPGLSNYPAAQWCYLKNDKNGDGFVKAENGEKEEWYLPSQNQLMAIGVAFNGIPPEFMLNSLYYWTTFEVTSYSGLASTVSTSLSNFVEERDKPDNNYVRCVRDVTP